MKLAEVRLLDGVNAWFSSRTIRAVVTDLPSGIVPESRLAALAERLDGLVLPPHLAGPVARLGIAATSRVGWGDLIITLAAELQLLSGSFAGSQATRATPDPCARLVAMECEEVTLAEACIRLAVLTCDRLHQGDPLDLARDVDRLVALADEVCLGGATGPIVAAACRRGIPAYRLDGESLVQLGEGVHQARIRTAVTGRTGLIADAISTDKQLVKSLWRRIGVPTPPGRPVHDEGDAARAAREMDSPWVVKPQDADYGDGVSLGLTTEDQVREAYRYARERSATGHVLVERHLRGRQHRLLVVRDRVVAAVRREPPGVTGDGVHSIRQLVDLANRDARRGPDYRWPLHRLGLDEAERTLLAEAGLTPESVLPAGRQVDLLRVSSTTTGAVTRDVTDQVHPETGVLARDAVRVVGLDVAGLDLIASDIGRPLAEQGGGFLEINSGPGIFLHLAPICDRPRPIGEAIVRSLFPASTRGRVPLVVVVGQGLAQETARLVAEALQGEGRQVASSSPGATRLLGRSLRPADDTPPARLGAMMLHPRTEVVVLAASLSELLATGLGTDRCTALVLAEGPGTSEDGANALHRAEVSSLVRHLVASADGRAINTVDPFWEGSGAEPAPASFLPFNVEHPSPPRRMSADRTTGLIRGREDVIRVGAAGPEALAEWRRGCEGSSTASPIPRALAAAALFLLG